MNFNERFNTLMDNRRKTMLDCFEAILDDIFIVFENNIGKAIVMLNPRYNEENEVDDVSFYFECEDDFSLSDSTYYYDELIHEFDFSDVYDYNRFVSEFTKYVSLNTQFLIALNKNKDGLYILILKVPLSIV